MGYSDDVTLVGLDLDDDGDLASKSGIEMGAAQWDTIHPMRGGLLAALFPRLLVPKLSGADRGAKGASARH